MVLELASLKKKKEEEIENDKFQFFQNSFSLKPGHLCTQEGQCFPFCWLLALLQGCRNRTKVGGATLRPTI